VNVTALRKIEDDEQPGAVEAQGELLPEVPEELQRLWEADDDVLPAPRWAEGLVNLIQVQEATFRRSGLDAKTSFRLARASVLAMAQYYGGKQWYLPRGDDLHTALRDADIYRRANRDNIEALAAEYKLTPRSVWRIVRDQHRLHLNKVQGQLFQSGEK